MSELATRIVADNTCVIEGSFDELVKAAHLVIEWRLTEECKERKLDYDWIRQLNDAEHAIRKRVHELREQGMTG